MFLVCIVLVLLLATSGWASRTIYFVASGQTATFSAQHPLSFQVDLDPLEFLGLWTATIGGNYWSTMGGTLNATMVVNGYKLYSFSIKPNLEGRFVGLGMNNLHVGRNIITLTLQSGQATVSPFSLFMARRDSFVTELRPWSGRALHWYTGVSHVHSRFSDGLYSISTRASTAYQKGMAFMVSGDHSDQIGSSQKPPDLWGWISGDGASVGWEDYYRQCNNATNDGVFVVVPGTEISVRNGVGSNPSESHLLDIYYLSGEDPEIDWAHNTPGAIDHAVSWSNIQGCLTVAAHPYLVMPYSLRPHPWEYSDFRFDFRLARTVNGLRGFEMFGSYNTMQEEQGFATMLRAVGFGQSVFVSSSADLHLNQTSGWQKITGVCAENLTRKSLVEGFLFGRTWAAAKGGYLAAINTIPGYDQYHTGVPRFDLTVGFTSARTGRVNLEIYRNGRYAGMLYQTGVSSKLFRFVWTDTKAVGATSYVFRVPGYLVISPVYFNR